MKAYTNQRVNGGSGNHPLIENIVTPACPAGYGKDNTGKCVKSVSKA